MHAQNLVKLGGGSRKVFESAKTAYIQHEYQWCLELTEALQHHPEDLNLSEINELQSLSLRKLASLQTSANGRNWYLTKSLEVRGLIEVKPNPFQKAQSILRLTLTNVFILLSVNFNYQVANEIDQFVLFHFNDTDEKFSVHIRNGIVDVQSQWPRHSLPGTINMIIEVKEAQIWKQVIARVKSPTSSVSNGEVMVKYVNGEVHSTGEYQLRNFLAMFTL